MLWLMYRARLRRRDDRKHYHLRSVHLIGIVAHIWEDIDGSIVLYTQSYKDLHTQTDETYSISTWPYLKELFIKLPVQQLNASSAVPARQLTINVLVLVTHILR